MASGVAAGRQVRREFWLLVRSGVMRRQAAVALGLDPDTGRDWFRQAGGVVPAFVTKLPSGRFLSLAEREEIFAGVERGDSIRGMARDLDRAPSTVLRELRRNMRQPYRIRSRWHPPATQSWDYHPAGRNTEPNAGPRDPSRPSSPRLCS
jgi:transposase-like protein